MKLSSKILLIVAFSCGIIAYNLRFWLWEDAFYHFIALEFVLLYFLIWNEVESRIWSVVARTMALVCLDSLIDELFFDPTRISLNEYIGFVLIIIITIFYEKYRRRPA